MATPTRDTWARDLEDVVFFDEDGGTDVLDLERAEVLLSLADDANTAARRRHGQSVAEALREEWLRELLAEVGIGSVEDCDSESLEEILVDLFEG